MLYYLVVHMGSSVLIPRLLLVAEVKTKFDLFERMQNSVRRLDILVPPHPSPAPPGPEPVPRVQPPTNPNLPSLPPFPTAEADIFAIELAQAVMVLGPFKRTEVNTLVSELGNLGQAQVASVKKFLGDKMLKSPDDIHKANIVEACWTTKDCLLVKFKSVSGASL